MKLEQLGRFMEERELIRQRRAAGHAWPWTHNPILQQVYFCNIERERDKTTKWIAQNWREPNKNDPDLWFALVIARTVNQIDSLEAVGYPVPWDKEHFVAVMRARRRDKKALFSGAYLTGRPGAAVRAEYHADKQFDPLWTARERLRPMVGDTLEAYWNVLREEHGFGGFLAQQVVADLMYVEPLLSAEDWFTFCAPGPGSVRGLNLLTGRSLRSKWDHEEFQRAVHELQGWINRRWDHTEPLHAQNITNVLCEFAKYNRAQTGRGVRRKYRHNG